MKKALKTLLAVGTLAGALTTAPMAQAGDPPDGCLIKAGCWNVDGVWYCVDPRTYALCDWPEGGL